MARSQSQACSCSSEISVSPPETPGRRNGANNRNRFSLSQITQKDTPVARPRGTTEYTYPRAGQKHMCIYAYHLKDGKSTYRRDRSTLREELANVVFCHRGIQVAYVNLAVQESARAKRQRQHQQKQSAEGFLSTAELKEARSA